MLGSQFEKQLGGLGGSLAGGFEVVALDRDDLDVTDSRAMSGIFDAVLPDVVVNCTGYTNVDEAEFEKKEAFALNAAAVKNIASLCDKHGAILIHFSTDYVFDGHKDVSDGGYKEDAMPNPLNVYGETKFKAEEFIQKEMARFFIVRTSWLYGPRPSRPAGAGGGSGGGDVGGSGGGNFVDTMLRLGGEVLRGEREGLNVVCDQFGSPTYTADLVRAVIDEFLMKFPDHSPNHLPNFGIYHLTGDGFCSWYEFAVRIFELAELRVEVGRISTAQYRTAAQRPKNSILVNTKLPKMRKWDEALGEYLKML
ncbi:MAG: dTDP-4-dehydrorhamnose reductase [Candidatus Gracilibacteria bacterium]